MQGTRLLLCSAFAPLAFECAIAACGGGASGGASPPDASASRDGSMPDARPFDASTLDGATKDGAASDALGDAPSDASVDAPPAVILAAIGADDASTATVGATFHSGAWSPLVPFGAGSGGGGGGGVAFLPSGEGLAFFAEPGLEYALWSDAGWGAFAPALTAQAASIGSPTATAQGAYAAHSDVNNSIFLDTWSGSWASEPTGWTLGYPPPAVAAVASTLAGDPVVLASVCAIGMGVQQGYMWSTRHAGVWSQPTSLPGGHPSACLDGPRVAAVGRMGVDQVVAVMRTSQASPPQAPFFLEAQIFAAGVWSAPTTIANDPAPVVALAALPDGRVALAYQSSTGAIEVELFDGTTWSAPRAVPMATLAPTQSATQYTLSIAPGVAGVVLEVAYADASWALRHVRLLDEAMWSWSTPASLDATRQYSLVSIASHPSSF